MSRRHGRGWSGLPAAGLLVLALPARADLVLIDGGGNDAADLVGAYLSASKDGGVVATAVDQLSLIHI